MTPPLVTNMNVNDYKQLDDIDHVLQRPVTYLGQVGLVTAKVWRLDDQTRKASYLDTVIQPALDQLFNEATTNSTDCIQRTEKLNAERIVEAQKTQTEPILIPLGKIEWTVSASEISVYNEGHGIPIDKHPETGIYVPELIFFHLRSSSNYDDSQDRSWSGVNGLGAKLIAIWSVWVRIVIEDPVRHLRYEQTVEHNMRTIHSPVLTPYHGHTASVRITYRPDFVRFGMEEITPPMIDAYRWFAAGANWVTGVPLWFNGRLMNYTETANYASIYCLGEVSNTLIHEDEHVKLCLLDMPEGGFSVSYVNGSYTRRAGAHVNETLKVFASTSLEKLNGKKSRTLTIKDVKRHLSLIIACRVINPQFTSQSKEEFVRPAPKIVVPDKTLAKVAKWDFVKQMALYADLTLKKDDKPAIKGKAKKLIVPKLEQANLAGTSAPCVLLLTEGDSAKSFAIMWRATQPRGADLYSIYPLKGKPLNVRTATLKQLRENEELVAIRDMLNLRPGLDYSLDDNFGTLTHQGGVCFMTDSDVDGHHIRGLGLNLFGHHYTSLANRGYVQGMLTPLLRAVRGNESLFFSTKETFNTWMATQTPNAIAEIGKDPTSRQWAITYFKGLGRWEEEMFADPRVLREFRIVHYRFDEAGHESLRLAFDRSLADARKDWVSLPQLPKPTYRTEHGVLVQDTSDFVSTCLREFSIEDNIRSLPCVVDNLKQSQRKVIHGMHLRKLGSTPVKVSVFMGFVSENTGYEHGEEGLAVTILYMAQNYAGSNLLPLVEGKGNVGNRIKNGENYSDPRYVSMAKPAILDKVIRKEDEPLLEYLTNDGMRVEPRFYIPIVPLILINGAEGIGTGFSTSATTFHPTRTVTPWVRAWIANHCGEEVDYPELIPYFRGFKGRVYRSGVGQFTTEGVVVQQGAVTKITEIPIGMSLTQFSAKIDKWYEEKKITNFTKDMQTSHADFTITGFANPTLKNLGLVTTISTTNTTYFDPDGYMAKYANPESATNDYCLYRYQAYERRRTMEIEQLQVEISQEEQKIAFVREVVEGSIVLTSSEVEEVVSKKGYPPKYLDMSLKSVTPAGLERRIRDRDRLLREVEEVKAKTARQRWESELDEFDAMYNKKYA